MKDSHEAYRQLEELRGVGLSRSEKVIEELKRKNERIQGELQELLFAKKEMQFSLSSLEKVKEE